MATFSAIVTDQSSDPALVVTIADPGVPGVTYQQVKNSLGQYVYMLQGFYVTATSLSQLIGVVKYLRYDANGNQLVTNIISTVDPYQDQKAVVIDLANFESDVVLNGNSNVQFVVKPNVQMQLKMYTRRITSSFGRNLKNYLDMERIAYKPGFFADYGNLFRIAQDNMLAQESARLGVGRELMERHRQIVRETGEEVTVPVSIESDPIPVMLEPEESSYVGIDGRSTVDANESSDMVPVVRMQPNYGIFFLAVAGASFLGYIYQKSNRGG